MNKHPFKTGGARAELSLRREVVEDQRGGWKMFMITVSVVLPEDDICQIRARIAVELDLHDRGDGFTV